MKLVLLWTDCLFFLLLAGIALMVPLSGRNIQLREQWGRVFGSRVGVASAMVLCAFLVTAALDSVHFRPALENAGSNTGGQIHYSPRVLSLLDCIFGELNRPAEKTYSVPFASHAFCKENVLTQSGDVVREFPRLSYGGRHLEDPENEKLRDIMSRTGKAVVHAFMLWALIAVSCVQMLAWRQNRSFSGSVVRIWRPAPAVFPWRTVFAVLLVIFLVSGWLYEMSRVYHVLGTDKVGMDVLFQALKSIRTGVLIGLLTTLVMLPIAILFGVSAGYFGGWIDDVIQYVYTTLNSIPGVLLIAAAILILQVYMNNHPELFDTEASRSDMRLLFLCIILGVTSWTGLCRMLRAETLKLRSLEYVDAARAFAVRSHVILARHILPNVLHIVLISVALDFSGLVLAEAVLSYVGVGVDPSMNSWGNMINSARLELAREPVVWWPLASAFFFMFCLVLAANLFADAVRDAFDPRTRMVK